jgi:hypothetical protein
MGAGTSRSFTNRQNRGLGVQLDSRNFWLLVFFLFYVFHRALVDWLTG